MKLQILALFSTLAIASGALAQSENVSINIGAGPTGMSMNINSGGQGAAVTMRTIGAYHDAVILDRARLLTTLGDLNEELARLQGLTAGGDRGACRRAAGDLKALRRSIRLLQDDLRAAPSVDMGRSVEIDSGSPPPQPEPLPPPEPVGPVALRGAQFSEILSAVRSEDFEDGKLGTLRDATDYAWYTVGQVTQILNVFDFGSGKLKALEIMAPQIINPERSFKIYSAFDFDSDKKKARRIIQATRR